jgi:hypothetical protein
VDLLVRKPTTGTLIYVPLRRVDASLLSFSDGPSLSKAPPTPRTVANGRNGCNADPPNVAQAAHVQHDEDPQAQAGAYAGPLTGAGAQLLQHAAWVPILPITSSVHERILPQPLPQPLPQSLTSSAVSSSSTPRSSSRGGAPQGVSGVASMSITMRQQGGSMMTLTPRGSRRLVCGVCGSATIRPWTPRPLDKFCGTCSADLSL